MSIISFNVDTTGLVGDAIRPRRCTMITTDSLATITTPGYLNAQNTFGHPILPTDRFEVTYNYNTATKSGVIGIFSINYSNATGFTLVNAISDIIYTDVTVGYSALSNAGSVIIQTIPTAQQYKIRNIFLNKVGTNFSGGGDRNLQITDGTNVFSVIPAATLQTLTNSVWGSTAVPFPASVSINTSSAAGANLVASYSGGTTDYTAGSLTLTLALQRAA